MPQNDVGNPPIRGGGCRVTYSKGALEAPYGWRVKPHSKRHPRVGHETREFLRAQDKSYVAEYLNVIPKLYQKTGLVGKMTAAEKAVRVEEVKQEKEEKAAAKAEKMEFNKNKKRPSRAKGAKAKFEAEGPEEGWDWSLDMYVDEEEILWEERNGISRTCIAPSFKRVRWDEDSVPRKGAGRGPGKAPRKAAGKADDTCDDSTVVLSKRGLSSEEGHVVDWFDMGNHVADKFQDDWDIFDMLWGKAEDV
jgi:hypothetical protein